MSEIEEKTTADRSETTISAGEGQEVEHSATEQAAGEGAPIGDSEVDDKEQEEATEEEATQEEAAEEETAEEETAEEEAAEEEAAEEEAAEEETAEEETPEDGDKELSLPPRTIATSPLSLAISSLVDEKQSLRDRWLRTAADFENFKKRARRDVVERTKQAEDRMVQDFLPVVDNLERALEHGEQSEGPLLDGVNMVYKQFLSTLERYGITPCEAMGQPFDPEFHEAIQQMHSDLPVGSVCNVLQRGYRRRERLVRAALVVVSLGPAEEKAEEPGEAEEATADEVIEAVADEVTEAVADVVAEAATDETVEEAAGEADEEPGPEEEPTGDEPAEESGGSDQDAENEA